MPTNQNAYNSRVTSESLEKKFRDTFTSQGGAELVDDLYASGVVVPVVDFTAAAEGSALRADLQTALDYASGNDAQSGAVTDKTIINTPGFWRLNIYAAQSLSTFGSITYSIDDGATAKTIFLMNGIGSGSTDFEIVTTENTIIFLRSGDKLRLDTVGSAKCNVTYRQIADVSGNLVNPLGFTSS